MEPTDLVFTRDGVEYRLSPDNVWSSSDSAHLKALDEYTKLVLRGVTPNQGDPTHILVKALKDVFGLVLQTPLTYGVVKGVH